MPSSERLRERLYRLAYEPVRVDTGTAYECDPRHLAYYHRHPGPNRQRLVSGEQATLEIVRRNSDTRREEDVGRKEWEAMGRLSEAVKQAATTNSNWGPDLIVKMFADLDLVFFNGRLLGNVLVRWHDLDRNVLGVTTTGVGRRNQTSIKLSPYANLYQKATDSPFRSMFSTMLHEMCVSDPVLGRAEACSANGLTARVFCCSLSRV